MHAAQCFNDGGNSNGIPRARGRTKTSANLPSLLPFQNDFIVEAKSVNLMLVRTGAPNNAQHNKPR
jgi:hypothetical protein